MTGCKPKAGESCKSEGQATCLDAQTQLVCTGGSYAAYPCKGALGCHGKDAVCDLSGNGASDVCSARSEGKKFCSADHKSRVRCEKGKVATERCDGVGGCTSTEASVDCNRDEPVIGEACGAEFDDQCSKDRTRTFHCEHEKWVAGRPCRGPRQCEPASIRPTCDATLALEGDACGPREEARSTCSVDRRSILRCESGRFKTDSACPAGKSCTFAKPANAWEAPKNEVAYRTSFVLLSMGATCE